MEKKVNDEELLGAFTLADDEELLGAFALATLREAPIPVPSGLSVRTAAVEILKEAATSPGLSAIYRKEILSRMKHPISPDHFAKGKVLEDIVEAREGITALDITVQST